VEEPQQGRVRAEGSLTDFIEEKYEPERMGLNIYYTVTISSN
jgi:hypothetical protein